MRTAIRANALAAWMTAQENPYFAKVIVNRVWADLMGRGIVDPVDDIRATNPPTQRRRFSRPCRRFPPQWLRHEKAAANHHVVARLWPVVSEPSDRNAGDSALFLSALPSTTSSGSACSMRSAM